MADSSVAWTYDDKAAFYAYPPYPGDQETHPEGTYPPNEEPDGTRPVYHFWSEGLKCHFYTIDPSERDEKLANQCAYRKFGPSLFTRVYVQLPTLVKPL